MDAPSHPGAEVVFEHLQIFGAEARRGHKAHAKHIQRFLFKLALDNIADAFEHWIQASEKTAFAGVNKIVQAAADFFDDRHATAAFAAFSGEAGGIAHAVSYERHGVIHQASQHHLAHFAGRRWRAVLTQDLGHPGQRMGMHATGLAFVPEALHLRLPVLVEDARGEGFLYGAPLVIEQSLGGSERSGKPRRWAARLPVEVPSTYIDEG